MSRFIPIVAATCLLLGGAAQADPRLYLQLQGGLSIGHDADVSDRRGGTNGEIRYEHAGLNDLSDLGLSGGGALGLHFGKSSKHSFRAELAGNYNRLEINKLVVDPKGPVGSTTQARGGNTSVATAFVNGYYEHDFGNLAWFKGFVGGGLGVGFVEFEKGRSSSIVLIDDDSTEFAYNATAGVVLPLGDHVDLTAAYRFLGTTEAELDSTRIDPNTGAFTKGSVDVDVHMHDILFGVRVTF
jgi:opacity protein-like surface antigen